jgi:2-dehydro-3-deoxygalactonokinase
MVGARNGLHEAGYADCPADAAGWRQSAANIALDGVPLRIGAGVACRDADGRPDVMRGEETQLFGAIRRDPALGLGRHIVVLPGTHSKWAWLEDGRITTFRTFLTGEMFALLQGSSLLSAGREGHAEETGDGFGQGLVRAQAEGVVLGSVFETRAAQLRDGHSAAWGADFLSGLLLGCELAEMRRLGALPAAVSVIGGAALAQRYARALAAFDVSATLLGGDDCALAGLELLDADD